jgi:hypothetical protein
MGAVQLRDGRLVLVRQGPAVAHEAMVLRAIAGPGVPDVVAFDDGPVPVLVSSYLPPLALDRLALEVAVRALAAVADVFARAHAAGIVHGPLRPDHLQGRPEHLVVAGWSAAGAGSAADDVREIGRLLDTIAGDDAALRATANRTRGTDAFTAHGLSAALRAWSPARQRRRAGLAPAGLTALGLAAVLLVVGVGASKRPVRSDTTTASTSTTATAPSSVVHDGRSLHIGVAGDVVITGRFHCSDKLPAVLRPSTGEVWVFDDWQPGPGSLVARIPGADRLRIQRAGACDRLEVRDGQGRWRTVG